MNFAKTGSTSNFIAGIEENTRLSQTITFGILPVKTYGDAAFQLGATSGSGLTITYSSSDPTVATVAGSTVTIIAPGATTITANQAGDPTYNAATPVAQLLTVNKLDQSITFGTLTPIAVISSPITVSATGGNSGNPVVFTSSNPAVATCTGTNGTTITPVSVGTCSIYANQAGNTYYNAATQVARTLEVKPFYVNPALYQYSMNTTGIVLINHVESVDINDIVAAFVGGECRGTGNPIYMPAANRYFVFMPIYSNQTSGETLTFKIFDNSSGQTLNAVQSATFTSNSTLGLIDDPYVWSNIALSQTADLLTYSIPQQVSPAIINTSAHTIQITVPSGTDKSALVASFTSSQYSTVKVETLNQVSGITANDFTNPVVYTVIAEDPSYTQNWTITVVSQTLGSDKDFLTFSMAQQIQSANIDNANHTVQLVVAMGTNLANLVAGFTLSPGASAKVGATPQTSGVTVNNFTNPVIYTIIAEDLSTQDWSVTVLEEGYSISGIVTYNNNNSTPMDNINVYLHNSGGTIIDSVLTNENGEYTFLNKINGTYTLSASCQKAWGGGNATDALLIQRHFASLITLASPRVEAADVNASSSVNATDGLLIRRRFAGLISSFPSGNWYFNPTGVTLNFSNALMNFNAICFGDANGSFIPSGGKSTKTNSMVHPDTLSASINDTVEIQIQVITQISAGAISLMLDYPAGYFEILSISESQYLTGVTTNSTADKVYFVWNNINPVTFFSGDTLLTVQIKVLQSLDNAEGFSLNVQSEIADEVGQVIDNVTFSSPLLITNTAGIALNKETGVEMIDIYPNPACDIANIAIYVQKDEKMNINLLSLDGKIIKTFAEEGLSKGVNSLKISISDIPTGFYLLQFIEYSSERTRSTIKHIAVIK